MTTGIPATTASSFIFRHTKSRTTLYNVVQAFNEITLATFSSRLSNHTETFQLAHLCFIVKCDGLEITCGTSMHNALHSVLYYSVEIDTKLRNVQ